MSGSRQFIDHDDPPQDYSEEVKRECLTMSVNGLGFRPIQRVKGEYHTTVILWVKQSGQRLPDAYEPETTLQVGALDELEPFVGSKKQNLAVDSGRSRQTRHSRVGSGRL